MKRKFSDKEVGIIKELMLKHYKTSTIIDLMSTDYKIEVTAYDLNSIRIGESYAEVKAHLNWTIKANYVTPLNEIEKNKIKEIKEALVHGFTEEDIIAYFNISKTEMVRIRMGYAKYYNIAPEFNSELEKLFKRKKRVNIDTAIVNAIKKEYVENDGIILLDKLADKYKISSGTISKILNLNYYESVGTSCNESIKRIKKKMADEKNIKQKEKIKARIQTESSKISELRQRKDVIASKIKKYESKIKELLAS